MLISVSDNAVHHKPMIIMTQVPTDLSHSTCFPEDLSHCSVISSGLFYVPPSADGAVAYTTYSSAPKLMTWSSRVDSIEFMLKNLVCKILSTLEVATVQV